MVTGRDAAAEGPATGPTLEGRPADTHRVRLVLGTLAALTVVFVVVWRLPIGSPFQAASAYLPIHTALESVSILIAALVFAIAWNSFSNERAGNLMTMGCGLLAAAIVDFAHTMSFDGMPVFVTPASPEKAIDLWLAARFIVACTFMFVALRPWRPLPHPQARWLLLAGSVLLASLVLWAVLYHPADLPRTFVAGQGLTAFKIGAEYAIVAILALAGLVFLRDMRRGAAYDASSMFAAVAISILSELCFTLYSNVTDVFNLLGHVYKVIAYLFIYHAVFVASIREPFKRAARAEAEQRQHLRFLESLDRVNRAIQGATDPELMMTDVLDVTLTELGCDHAFLTHPWDPDEDAWRTVAERNRPGLSGLTEPNESIPLGSEERELIRATLAADGPMVWGPGSPRPLPKGVEARQVKSFLAVVVRPKIGKPWLLGVHQCSHARVWTTQETRLAAEIGRRLEDGLTTLLTQRELGLQVQNNRVLLDQASDAIFVADSNWHYVDVNVAACELLGYTRDELLQLTVPDVVPPDVNADQQRRFAQMKAGEALLSERLLRGKDGSLVACELSSRQLPDGRFQAIVRDITERKRLEEEQARLATAVEQADEAIVITDERATILYVNPSFERVSGYSRAELVGGNPRILQSGQHDRTFYEAMWSTLQAGQTWRGTFVNSRKDGELYEEDATIAPIRDHSGTVVSYVGVKRDVTHEHALEAQLRQSQKMEAVGQLAGGIAHDFNNLITAIRGYSVIVRDRLPQQATERDDLDQVVLAADRAADLTRQLLAFSRRQVLQPQVVAPAAVVDRIAPMLRRLLGEHIELVTQAAPDFGYVRVDPSQLEQIIVNLAVNALDAMPDGGRLIVETEVADADAGPVPENGSAAPNGYVVLRVTDTGSGMDEETRAHAFEPFFTTKGPGRGTGMGLATVYGIVSQSGGEIQLQSESGQGTTLTLWLPRVTEGRAVAATRDSEEKALHGSGTILLVEDEASVRTLALRELQDLGYAVIDASDGLEARARVADQLDSIDLLVTDLVMPHMGGQELAAQLRVDRPKLPVLFMSGFAEKATSIADLNTSGASLLQKPFTREALAHAVRDAMKDAC